MLIQLRSHFDLNQFDRGLTEHQHTLPILPWKGTGVKQGILLRVNLQSYSVGIFLSFDAAALRLNVLEAWYHSRLINHQVYTSNFYERHGSFQSLRPRWDPVYLTFPLTPTRNQREQMPAGYWLWADPLCYSGFKIISSLSLIVK